MNASKLYRVSLIGIASLFMNLSSLPAAAEESASLSNQELRATVRAQDGSFEVGSATLARPIFTARVGAEVDHQWIRSTDYPKHAATQSSFQTELGSGHEISVSFSGLGGKPDLKYIVRLYDNLPFGDVQVMVLNSGRETISVQGIRVLEITGDPAVNLEGPDTSDRVLSDSYSEDRPPLHIFDLGKEPPYLGEDDLGKGFSDLHLAVGSQLIYNQKSKFSLFLAALSSDRWLTVMRLKTVRNSSGEPRIASYEVDSTGTTEVLKKESLRDDPPSDQIELSLPVPAGGGEINSEPVLFSFSQDYFAQLEAYGRAVRQLHHALVSRPTPWGWWSWTAYYFGLSQDTALSNAQWLAEHVKTLGFDFFHLDAGYSYADGEYTVANAALFPEGMEALSHQICHLGLNLALWTAPFRVSERAWVFQHHPEWLVHNAEGKPIQIGFIESSRDAIYVLDPTHPGAQDYLRYTYETLSRDWGVRYLKLDFMDDTAIEGVHYRPNTTGLEAERIGIQTIREGVGPDVYIDKDGSPMLNTVGLTELGRLSADTGHSFAGDKEDAPGIAARYYMNGTFYGADPDAFTVAGQLITDQTWHQSKTPLSLDDAEVSIALAAVAGGMFEIGDDLPTLSSEPDRVNLIENRDLLDMVRLQRSSKPIDLMTYSPEDEQPSIFLLREDARQTMLTVFNWTESPRSHQWKMSDLGLPEGHSYKISDIFHKDRSPSFSGGLIKIEDQGPHSVRLLKIVDTSMPAAAPSLSLRVPDHAELGHTAEFSATADSESTPSLAYRWDFGDGVSAEGPSVSHAYTHNGTYTVRLSAEGLDGIAATKTSSITISGHITTTYEVPSARRYEEHRTPQNP